MDTEVSWALGLSCTHTTLKDQKTSCSETHGFKWCQVSTNTDPVPKGEKPPQQLIANFTQVQSAAPWLPHPGGSFQGVPFPQQFPDDWLGSPAAARCLTLPASPAEGKRTITAGHLPPLFVLAPGAGAGGLTGGEPSERESWKDPHGTCPCSKPAQPLGTGGHIFL